MLRIIFRPRREKGAQTKLQNEKPYSLYPSPNITSMIAFKCMGEAYRK
jgi:hypothetical protein